MNGTTALDTVLQQAHTVHVSPVHRSPASGEIRIDLSDPGTSAQLRTAMTVESLPGAYCMCVGDVRFDILDQNGGRLALIVLHHGISLRWEQWEGHATLTDGRLLLAWLDRHGMPGPMRQFEAARRQAEEEAEEQRHWVAATPAGLEETTDRILNLSNTGSIPSPELLAELTDRLNLAIPDPVERVLALLHWHGSGSGRCTGYPLHEEVPGELLATVPISDLHLALTDPRAGERHRTGAVRHLVGWKTRPHQKRDVAGLPEPLRAQLLAHAHRIGDPDTQGRARRWLAPPRD